MNTIVSLTDEDRAVLASFKMHFADNGMRNALALLRNERRGTDDLLAVIDVSRELYLHQRQ
jgi:hypothetical protein